MIKLFLKSKYITLVISVFMFLNTLGFIAVGVVKAIKGYKHIYHYILGEHVEQPALHLAESLDTFLVAIVALIISIGIAKIFFFSEEDSSHLPKWLDVHSFKELKILLWETILLTLVVLFITMIPTEVEHLTWSVLIIPVATMILALSLVLMKGDFFGKGKD